MTVTSWTDERVAVLRTLWAEGLSAAQIAARLGGATRNAVLGKAYRLGLCGTRSRPPAAPKLRERGSPKRRPSRAPRPRASRRPAVPDPRALELAALEPRLERLGPGCCRWPVGDPRDPGFAFCGRPVTSAPYCPAHRRVAYL